ncbi:MAG: threonine synthase [Gammaproteobacteria bacterium]|nr:threonine synthase [Gammaproteobacteria bacterium]
MSYCSTRGHNEQVDAAIAIARGLAPDGGLYVPLTFPEFAHSDFAGCETIADTAFALVRPFVEGSVLTEDLRAICNEAFNFPIPLVPLIDADASRLSMLELFHGPTAAFKDVGARFLAACMERIEGESNQPLKILVATSGDTGGAVAAAFHGRRRVEVDVFYPAGQVSARQEQQLTCWGDNVRAFRVSGRFDDCQRLVKEVFQDNDLNERHRFSSANSINLGRLLPQMVYYAHTAMTAWNATGEAPDFIIPTGNLGNALACVWARRAGLPIGEIVLATNANRTIPDYLDDGAWRPRDSISTLASAMDVGNPSNMERLRGLYPDLDEIRDQVSAHAVTDAQIAQQIKKDFKRFGQIWCPHTATAMFVYDQLPATRLTQRYWIAVATAHPAKFDTIVEPLIGQSVPVPTALERLLHLPSQAHDVAAQLAALRPYYT